MNVQSFVHSLEQGKIAGFFRLVLSLVAVIALALAYLLIQFRGLSTQAGIDQAQIAHLYQKSQSRLAFETGDQA